MICNIQLINNSEIHGMSTSETEKLNAAIQKALELIGVAKTQDSKVTLKQLTALLIEYILAEMRGDSAEIAAIQGQITTVIQAYEKNMQEGNELTKKLEAMKDNPGVCPSKDLAYLQGLIIKLEQDAASGNLSNLS